MAPLHPQFEFQVHQTIDSLEAPLARKPSQLEDLAARCDDATAYSAVTLRIRGKRRLIAIPHGELDSVQRRIGHLLFPVDLAFGSVPNGYVARRSVLTNASPHVGARFLQKFDIENFFPSVTADQVSASLSDIGFGSSAAEILARLVCRRRRLPVGSRTSPRVSNLVLSRVDEALLSLATDRRITYTRYADDLAFSSAEPFDLSAEVATVVHDAGFSLNAQKSRSLKHGQPMFVTGLSIEDAKGPHVRKALKARLRQEFYYIERYGLDEHSAKKGDSARWTASRLVGEYHYCRAIEPSFAAQLARSFPEAYKTVIPAHSDSRSDRARRHRDEMVASVRKAPARALPYYMPSVPLRGG